MAVVADATTKSGLRGVRLRPWTYTGRTVVGGEAADRKLASLMQALKHNVKTYGQLQQTYQFVLAECPDCNPTAGRPATTRVKVNLPADWVASDTRLFRFVYDGCPFDIVVPETVGAGMSLLADMPVPTGGRDPRLDAVSWRLCPESRHNTCARREGAKARLRKG